MRTVEVTCGPSIARPSAGAAERRKRSTKCRSWAVAVVALAASVFPVALAGAQRDAQARPVGEVLPDKALVYLIRPSATAGSALTMYVYSDQVFLGTLCNAGYAFAQVEPGEHVVWSNLWKWLVQDRFEFVAGQTYYLEFTGSAIILLDKYDGPAAIKAHSYTTTTERAIETSKRHAGKRWAKIQERDAAEPRVTVEKIVADPAPVDVTGKVRVPKGTTLELELLENVSSAHARSGDTVRFRIVDDLVIDNYTLVHAGAAVEAKLNRVKAAAGNGQPGVIDIVFPGLRAADGSPVPLVGRQMIVGTDREESAIAASNGLIGMLVASTIKGGETLIRIGEVYEVVTPIDVWVDPNRATPPAPDSAGVGLPESELAATANGVGCKLKTACRDLDDIVVQVQSEQRPSKVALRAIDGRELPAPVAASAVQPGREGTWTCTLPGWSVVRNLPLKEGTATAALQMTGSLENGTDFRSDTTLEVVVRR